MPRFAAIDIGSNSIKLLIVDRSGSTVVPVYETSVTTRLGENMYRDNLGEPAMRRTLTELKTFVETCKDHNVERTLAVGTEALRNAGNSGDFVERCAGLGLMVEPIAGDEEARLSFLSVALDPLWKGQQSLGVMDVGGGSTELIIGSSKTREINYPHSQPVGAVRITDEFLESDPPTIRQIDRARRAVGERFAESFGAHTADAWVGVGGTFTNLARMNLPGPDRDFASVHGASLTLNAVQALRDKLLSCTVEERRHIPGLDPSRADIIAAGALIIAEAMELAGAGSIAVSTKGLRWGVVYGRLT